MTIAGGLTYPPSAVLFDWDSTLVDNWSAIRDAINHTFVRRGMPIWTRSRIMVEARQSARDRFPSLFGEDWEQAREEFLDYFKSRHLETLRALDGSNVLLRVLRGRGVPVGLVSNKHGDVLRREVEHLGWGDHFFCVVGATDASRDKPAPDPVFLALADSGIEPDRRVWFVGDTDVDMISAHSAGCSPILVRNHPPEKGEFDASPLACYVSSRWDLVSIVERVGLGDWIAETEGDPGG